MAELPTVVFVTGNKGKLTEVQEMLKGTANVEAVKIDLPELQGEALDIARDKALTAYAQLQRPCMIEDTGLCFHGMKNLPGPYIKWFLDKVGNDGLNDMLVGFEDKSAHAECTFTVATGPTADDIKCYVGRCEGTIVRPRGPGGFGWDPVFLPTGSAKTFAEMSAAEKNEISHRRRALDLVRVSLASQPTGADAATGNGNGSALKRHRSESKTA
jgi:inosine triphosphate pyrophosphatase